MYLCGYHHSMQYVLRRCCVAVIIKCPTVFYSRSIQYSIIISFDCDKKMLVYSKRSSRCKRTLQLRTGCEAFAIQPAVSEQLHQYQA